MAESRTLDILLEEVAKAGRTLTTFLSTNSYYQPSFRPGGLGEFPELPEDAQVARTKLREAAKAVYDLATGPEEYIKQQAWNYHDNSVLRWLVHFRIPQAVPLVGSVTYAHIANTCDVDETQLRRILRYAMLNNIFYETSPEEVAHTPFSSVLITNSSARTLVEYNTDESFPASVKVVEAYDKWGADEEPNHNAWCLANGTDLPIYEHLAQPGLEERADRFARLMSAINSTPGHDLKYTLQGYNWKSVKGTIVDIGGSIGQTAVALAKEYPDLPEIIVVDVQRNVEKGEAQLPEDLKSKVYFHAHDFFNPHPETIISSKVFVLRRVLHDYSDKYARRIVRQLVPALKNGATLVVIDSIVPEPGSGNVEAERTLRRMDMEMMQMFSGREREMEDWADLFKSADPKLIVRNVNQPVGSALGFMEVVFDG